MSSHQSPMFRRREEACLSDYALDRLRLGELPTEEGERSTAHVQVCPHCRARLHEIEVVVAPAIDLETDAVARPQVPRTRKRRLWILGLPACAAAALVVMIGVHPGTGERSKGGGWQLGVIAQYPNGRVTSVSAGSALAPGDRLRFEVAAPQDAFVSVISLDATGAVTPFVPATGAALPVRAGQHRLLDGAVELDGSLGPEHLLLVACPQAVAVDTVVAAARAALERAHGKPEQVDRVNLACPQTWFRFRKEIRP
jgi:hypothetical protein